MTLSKQKEAISSILLSRLEIEVFKPFTASTLEATIVNLGLACKRAEKDKKSLAVRPSIKMIIEEPSEAKSAPSKHLQIDVEYFVCFEDMPKAKRTKKFGIEHHAFKIVWPYFREDINTLLLKSGYHPFLLKPYETYDFQHSQED